MKEKILNLFLEEKNEVTIIDNNNAIINGKMYELKRNISDEDIKLIEDNKPKISKHGLIIYNLLKYIVLSAFLICTILHYANNQKLCLMFSTLMIANIFFLIGNLYIFKANIDNNHLYISCYIDSILFIIASEGYLIYLILTFSFFYSLKYISIISSILSILNIIIIFVLSIKHHKYTIMQSEGVI